MPKNNKLNDLIKSDELSSVHVIGPLRSEAAGLINYWGEFNGGRVAQQGILLFHFAALVEVEAVGIDELHGNAVMVNRFYDLTLETEGKFAADRYLNQPYL